MKEAITHELTYADFDARQYSLAYLTYMILQRVTGDKCHLIRIESHWRIVRLDVSGKQVEWV